MLNLLLSTLAMMGLTFIIGFFVAGVIKIIANWADFLDFYNLHREEILNLKKEHRPQQVVTISDRQPVQKNRSHEDKLRKLAHKINETINNLKPRKRIAA